jgi:hypothetical protein
LQEAVIEIINNSDSVGCTEIPDTLTFSDHFCFGGISSGSSEEEISRLKPSVGKKEEH